jgi:hypothetical protein
VNPEPPRDFPLARPNEIRRLGFEPEHLTPEEQMELLDIDARLRQSAARERDLVTQ